MMVRALNKREKVLLVFLVVILIAALYYWIVYMPVKEELREIESREAQLEEEILLEETRAARKAVMQNELDAIFADPQSVIAEMPDYDNLGNVMVYLNAILASTHEYSINFGAVEESGGAVRRTMQMSFSCSGYKSARAVIQDIYSMPYRCLIKDISFDVADGNVVAGGAYSNAAGIASGNLNIGMSVTFFEKP